MALIRNGHQRVFEYGYYFFTVAQQELDIFTREHISDLAYAHRISKAPEDKWKKFVESSSPPKPKKQKEQKKKQMTKEDHMRVIARLKGIR